MSEFDRNKIRRLDLTVLLIFLALMRTRKAADVASELGLTNSSISHALRRLRDVFEDELFLRRPHGLEPTAFAEHIEPDVRRAIEAVQAALTGPEVFDPTTSQGLIRISAKDREVAGLIPDAFTRVKQHAPNLRFSVRSMPSQDSLQGLREGSLDLAIGYFNERGKDFERTHIRTETYLVAARKGHPILRGTLAADTYANASHILVSGDGSLTGIVDDVLAKCGLKRRVSLAVPSFMPALAIVARGEFIATLPSSLVLDYADQFNLGFTRPPLEIRSFDVVVLRHRRNRKDPMLSWCLDKIAAR